MQIHDETINQTLLMFKHLNSFELIALSFKHFIQQYHQVIIKCYGYNLHLNSHMHNWNLYIIIS